MHYSLGESTIQNMALDACNTYLALINIGVGINIHIVIFWMHSEQYHRK